MLKWLAGGLWLVLPLWCTGEPHFSIALYTQFQHQPPAAVVHAIQDEVETIMAPMGASFEWRSLELVTGSEVSTQLAVVKFVGRCQSNGYDPQSPTGGALGWTHVSDGVILPFSDIDCDGIRRFLQVGLMGIAGQNRDEAYGRAVGRVLAHELYHIFANTAHHGSNGVGKGIYSVTDLLTRNFQFDERESDALRSNKPPMLDEVGDATR